MARILITGGAGFIGSTYARVALDARPDDQVVVFDKLTYAGREENLAEIRGRIEFVQGAIEDRAAVREAMDGADLVVNFAAESHVDRSIADQDVFAVTQVIGTGVLLDAVRDAGVSRFLQVSTDEVYGSIEEGTFTEESPIAPSSPY
jgi:dTDP-glucose 4,6-dehydratase